MAEYRREFYGASLAIKDDGQYEKDGKVYPVKAHISIAVGNGYLKLSALQLAGLLAAMQDKEVREELQKRFLVEKKALEGVGGF